MAESAISYVVQSLSDQIIQKAMFLKGVSEQVEWVRRELEKMQCFLKDQEVDKLDKNWVKDIRIAAYDAEDIIDTFVFTIESWRRRSFIKRYAHFSKELLDRRKVGKEIEALKSRISEISKRCETYGGSIGEGTASTSRERLHQFRRSSPREVGKDINGIKVDETPLKTKLLEKENQLTVISLVGMGGIGKTTLAKKVYNHEDVRHEFNCIAWTYVSQEFNLKSVLLGIIKEMNQPMKESPEKIDDMEERELEKMLYEHLQKKKYLVVLDDVWTKEDWDLLKKVFPDMKNGSKVMLTTRNNDVASHADPDTAPYKLCLLSEKESWDLFLSNAFYDGNCPKEYEEIGKMIVKGCGGLPLAIIVVGALLRRKHTVGEWQRVLNNMDSVFAKGDTWVLPILALSYNDLPYYLKSCFLHLGIFPEDYVISTRKLFHLWIAGGLIPQCEERMELTAEDYLKELIDRNMVQVVRTSADKRVKKCQLHDLLRDLSILKAKEEIFLEVHGKKYFQSSKNSRHHAVHSNFRRYFASIPSLVPKLRSLILFHPNNFVSADITMDIIFDNLKLLRVLDLENTGKFKVQRKIGKLINLRYLSLRATQIEKLPSSMRHLENLQTLDISETRIGEIPKFISKMKNLRHLYTSIGVNTRGKLRIDTLENLQTLSTIHVSNLELENPGKSSNLRELVVCLSSDSDVNRFHIFVVMLEKLESLTLVTVQANFPALGGVFQVNHLTKLRLEGGLLALPGPQGFPPNIAHLTLVGSSLEKDPMGVLMKLQQLSVLRLRASSYRGKKMVISAGGFPLLKFLELDGLNDLRKLTIEDGAMPRLRHFRISKCRSLRELPIGIMSATTLEELEICSMPAEFVNRLQGIDFNKVKHMPSITYS